MSRTSRRFNISVAGKRSHAGLSNLSGLLQELFEGFKQVFMASGEAFHIQLQTGIADGSDMLTAGVFSKWAQDNDTSAGLTGIIPFNKMDYLQTIEKKEPFEAIYASCNKIIVLDGHYLPDSPGDSHLAKECRTRAYRQQADYLLQTCDVLLAIADEKETGKAGGTLETAEIALKKGIPVIFLSLHKFAFFSLTKTEDLKKLQIGGIALPPYQPYEVALNVFNLLSDSTLK